MSLPQEGRLAGIDYGTVRIGIAITDPGQRIASPLENYQRGDANQDERRFQRLVEENQLVGFVVGLPVHSGGEESQLSTEARHFGKWLTEKTGLPVSFFDERFTSRQAQRMLLDSGMTKKRRKQRLDMLAAQILLSHYLESRRDDDKSPGALDDAP